MKKENYKLNTWYPLTDNEYWVEQGYEDEFPNCQTVVYCTQQIEDIKHHIMTYHNCNIGWGTMAKYGDWKFMIIELPK